MIKEGVITDTNSMFRGIQFKRQNVVNQCNMVVLDKPDCRRLNVKTFSDFSGNQDETKIFTNYSNAKHNYQAWSGKKHFIQLNFQNGHKTFVDSSLDSVQLRSKYDF